MELTGAQAKQILNTYWNIENFCIDADEINDTYKLLPTYQEIAGQKVKIMAIKRYVIMNFADLEYTVDNSDIIIDELLEELQEKDKIMATELINEQSAPTPEPQNKEPLPPAKRKVKSKTRSKRSPKVGGRKR